MVSGLGRRRPVVRDGAHWIGIALAALLAGACLPLGSLHEETGWLAREGGWLVLMREAGGRWRLDTAGQHDRLVGRWVRVTGTRGDFDMLDVQSIEVVTRT